MKKVLLVTSKNFTYRAPLDGSGCAVTEFRLPFDSTALAEIQRLPLHDYVIAEATAESVEKSPDLYRLLPKKGKVVCFADVITDKMRSFILDCGISDMLMKFEAESFLSFLSMIGEKPAGEAGTFIILDDESAPVEIVRSIVSRFNYGTILIKTADELFSAAINSGVRFILVNLGMRSLDLNGLVRKYRSSTAVRGIPVLAYKDMREGIFVHELVGGLNRLTRYILSLDELYWLLSDMLFRRELISLVAQLRKQCDFEANSGFDAETLDKVFYTCEKRLFDRTDLLDSDTLSSMALTLQAISRAILKVESLKWLRIEIDR
jgi:hypothetical protein